MDSTRHAPDERDGGLALEPPRLIGRRKAMSLFGVGLVTLVACSSDDPTEVGSASSSSSNPGSSTTSASGATATTGATGTADTCTDPIPEETAGPYPGDGSNGPNVLTDRGVVRSDITRSFGSSSGTADGVPLTIDLMVVDGAAGCVPLAGAAIYAWHCDREARYSLYTEGVEDQNYLRGVQEADDAGTLRFTSIFPAAYSGRWPHVHFEVYASLADATGGASPLAISQFAFPQDVCEQVYTTEGYEASVANLADTPLARDLVFSDGVDQQMAAMGGDIASGLTAHLTITV